MAYIRTRERKDGRPYHSVKSRDVVYQVVV